MISTQVANPKARPLLRALEVVAEKTSRTTTQVALNWCICKGVVPIPGARTKAQAEENCGAASFRLSKAEVVALDAYALDGEGFYRDPDAILCFLGVRPPRLLRPLLAALVRVALRVAAALLPLQPDGA